MPVPSRLLVLLPLAAACAGCTVDAFTYTTDRYGGISGVQVRLGCSVTYEVFDRPDAGSLIVVTNPFNELAEAGCGDRPPRGLAERQRQVAEIFMYEKTERPDCRFTGEAAVTERHREFNYRCPAPRPGEAAPAPVRSAGDSPAFGRQPVTVRGRR